jgi:hypothetical protein
MAKIVGTFSFVVRLTYLTEKDEFSSSADLYRGLPLKKPTEIV